ncbi:hypothetical protein B0H63DRAFT_411349, partial [Podospora didyma]
MDPLSVSASIIAVLQLSSDVFKYVIGAAGAAKERRRLRTEIIACESVLLQLQDVTDDADGGETDWNEKMVSLRGPNTPLSRLTAALEAVKVKLEPKKRLDMALSALKWPFDEQEVNNLISVIEREKSILQLALTSDCRVLMRKIKQASTENGKLLADVIERMKAKSTRDEMQFAEFTSLLGGIRTTQDGMEADVRYLRKDRAISDWQNVLDWFSPTDYASQQSDFVKRRQDGTGQWLLDSSEFKAWLKADSRTLFCPGIPGAGKTILASIVVNYLTMCFGDDDDVGVAYLYCNFQRQDEQTPDGLVSNLLKQLAEEQRHSVADKVRFLYDKYRSKGMRPSLDEISRCLQLVATTYTRVFIVVDALDECQTANGCRSKFLSEVFSLQAICPVSVFATSRFIPEIVERFRGSTSLEIRASKEDVEGYVQGRLKLLPAFVQQNQRLQEEIKNGIAEAADGMFLLAQIYLHSLDDKPTPKAIRNALGHFQKQAPGCSEDQKVEVLSHAYDQTMKRINGQRPGLKKFAKQILLWVTCAKRPLTTTELRHALAVEMGETALDPENLPQIEDVVSVCAGLVIVDEESAIARLVHYTAQEYFERTWTNWFPDAHRVLAVACATYLSFAVFRNGNCQTDIELEERLALNPLYSYASHNWGHHARNLLELPQEVVNFLDYPNNVQGSSQALMAVKRYSWHAHYSQEVPTRVIGLHLASYFGVPTAIERILGRGYPVDWKDSYNQTPLTYAARGGHESAIRFLLANNNAFVD